MSSLQEAVAAFLSRLFAPIDKLKHKLFGIRPKDAAGKVIEKRILCDYCKYNYSNVCFRPERPNATECPDYQPKAD